MLNQHYVFYYPLKPFTAIEDGKKIVSFNPPEEILEGEKIHQFIGARYSVKQRNVLPDIDRIHRQQIFLTALLKKSFEFSDIINNKVSFSDVNIFQTLKQICPDYKMNIYKNFYPGCIDNKLVLIKHTKRNISKNFIYKNCSFKFDIKKWIFNILRKNI